MSDDAFSMFGESGLTAARNASLEEQAVKRLLQWAGVRKSMGALRREAEQKYDLRRLSFEWLRAEYPAFPAIGKAVWLPRTHAVTLDELFDAKRAKKLPWIRTYTEWVAAEDLDYRDEWLVMVFNLPRAAGATLLALHNGPLREDDVAEGDVQCPQMIFRIARPRMTLIMESLQDFSRTIGSSWAQTD